jgi:hypothetical protein
MTVDCNLKIKNLAWNFVIYKVGSNYWLTNPKVGTRFLTNFSQEKGDSIYYSFTATPFVNTNNENIKFDGLHDTNGFIDNDTIHSYNRILWKIKGINYNKELMEDSNITDILSKVTHTIIRNPIERLKSGIIQILVEWFFETRQYFLRNESWSHINMFNDYSKQNNYNINWNTFYRMFDDDILNSYNLNLDIVNSNHTKVSAEWKREWKQFTELFLNDVIPTKFFEYNIDTNVHTQAFLHSQYNFLHDIGVYDNLSVVDLSELNTKRDLLLDGHPLKESLVNHFDSPLIRETNDIFKTINWDSLYKWVENSKVYAYELHAYYTMLNRKK